MPTHECESAFSFFKGDARAVAGMTIQLRVPEPGAEVTFTSIREHSDNALALEFWALRDRKRTF